MQRASGPGRLTLELERVLGVQRRLYELPRGRERFQEYLKVMVGESDDIELPLSNMPHRACPCASGQLYDSCCEPFHLDLGSAPTAERLMRSRYSAFHEGKIDYLIATLHASKRQLTDRDDLARVVSTTTWTGLRVLAVDGGTEGDETGHVEFVAYYCESGAAKHQAGTTKQLHERSRFVKEDGRWFYLSGDHESLRPIPKLGRNDPCWCGSGKKYKKCHS